MRVRNRPSLRQTIEVVDPEGRRSYWTEDAPDPADAFQDLSYSSAAPGGFATLDCKLTRKIAVAYGDMAPYATCRVRNTSGGIDWEGRLERAARTSGREVSASPSAVGFQAALEDDKSVRALYIDRDLSRWGDATPQRKLNVGAGFSVGLQWDTSTGADTDGTAVVIQATGRLSTVAGVTTDIGEAWYDARGLPIYQLRYDVNGSEPGSDPTWNTRALLSTDAIASVTDIGTDHNGASATGQTLTATVSNRLFAFLQTYYTSTFTNDGIWRQHWTPAVIGYHGLTLRSGGYYASDVIDHQIRIGFPAWERKITPTSYAITQVAYFEPTTRAEIVKDVNRFHTYDWFVWEGPLFEYRPRSEPGRRWRSPVGPAQLEETGQAADKMWRSVVVSWKDPDGTTRTVGPPGLGAQMTDTSLTNGELDIPADRVFYLPLDAAASGAAVQAGQRFLYEANQVDRSGKAIQVGYVEDADTGVVEPASHMRGGDAIAFTDASDTSFRRLSNVQWDRSSRTASLDLDAPGEDLQKVVERLNASVAGLAI